uniref:RCC1-like domain-containing protein n=1 Tax=Brevibacterium sp. FME17 TaxID=2742606 RepID=UPI0021F81255
VLFRSNSQGQCDVSSWYDVVAVAAGAEHSLGLRSDGTVLSTGSNNHGQCSVEEWQLGNGGTA